MGKGSELLTEQLNCAETKATKNIIVTKAKFITQNKPSSKISNMPNNPSSKIYKKRKVQPTKSKARPKEEN